MVIFNNVAANLFWQANICSVGKHFCTNKHCSVHKHFFMNRHFSMDKHFSMNRHFSVHKHCSVNGHCSMSKHCSMSNGQTSVHKGSRVWTIGERHEGDKIGERPT